jgi:hypothetical protein
MMIVVHHAHGRYVANVPESDPAKARQIAREAALADGLVLYRVIVAEGPQTGS